VKHPIYLPPNTVPLGELFQLKVIAFEKEIILKKKKNLPER